jgi:amino acid transporter
MAAVEEVSHLQRNVGRSDVFYFTICTLVGADAIGTLAAQGFEVFSWLVIFAIVFFVPSAMAFAELGSTFPGEGGPYLWVRLAFGRLPAAINNFFYYVSNPIWLGGALSLLGISTVEVFFLDGRPMSSLAFYCFALPFIWIAIAATIFSFNIGKWIIILGAFARYILLGSFSVCIIIYAQIHGYHGPHLESFAPSFSGMVALSALILFSYVGFDVPNNAGEEMKNPQRDVPYAIGRGAVTTFLLLSCPVLGMLFVLPANEVSGLNGFVEAIKIVFSVESSGILAIFMALLFILVLISSAAAWSMGANRALAVAGYDGAAPRWLGSISKKYGTPVYVDLLSGLIATSTLVATRFLSEGNTAKYFGVVLNLAVSMTILSYLLMFPALWRLRVMYPAKTRPYRAPFAHVISGWLTLCVFFVAVQIVAPGLGVDWFGNGFAPKGWIKEEQLTYLWLELVPIFVFASIGVIFWLFGSQTRRAQSEQPPDTR